MTPLELITNIPGLDKEMAKFVKEIVLMLCDKFVKDKKLNKRITNTVGGNMENIERYAQDKVDEKTEKFIINLKNNGCTIEEIIKLTETSKEFVEKTLSK